MAAQERFVGGWPVFQDAAARQRDRYPEENLLRDFETLNVVTSPAQIKVHEAGMSTTAAMPTTQYQINSTLIAIIQILLC
jgi:hypothetical protein